MLSADQRLSEAAAPPRINGHRHELLASSIPVALREVARWVLWKAVERNGKLTKVPLTSAKREASSTDPGTWTTHERAQQTMQSKPRAWFDGMGVVLGDLGDGWHLVGVDIDSCLDANGMVADWAQPFVDLLSCSYVEVSPSGTGLKAYLLVRAGDIKELRAALRIFAPETQGTKTTIGTGEHAPGVEVYLAARFFALTGERWRGASTEVEEVALPVLQKFAALLNDLKPATARHPGRQADTRDDSRSAQAWRIGQRCKRDGKSYEQFCAAVRDDPVTASWLTEKGLPHDERQLRRIWERLGDAALPSEDEPGWPEHASDLFDDQPSAEWPILVHDMPDRTPWKDRLTLPRWMAADVQRTAASIGVDEGAVAMAYLTAASGALPKGWRFQPYQDTSEFRVPPILWTALVAPPGSRKSPVVQQAIRGMQRQHKKFEDEFGAEFEEWNKLSKDDQRDSARPERRRLYAQNTTPEGLRDVLAKSGLRGMMLVQDELAAHLSLESYNKQEHGLRTFYLTAYEAEPYIVDRKTTGTQVIKCCGVSILGGIQPSVIATLRARATLDNDGTLARFCLVPLRTVSGELAQVGSGYRVLHDQIAHLCNLGWRSEKPRLYVTTHQGSDIIREVQAFGEKLAIAHESNPDVAAFAGKLHGLVARIAFVLQVIERPLYGDERAARELGKQAIKDDPEALDDDEEFVVAANNGEPFVVSTVNVRRAETIVCNYLLPNAMRMYEAMGGQDTALTRDVAAWVLTSPPEDGRLHTADLTQRFKKLRRDERLRDRVLAPLVMGGWLHPVYRGRALRCWLVNPSLQEQFPDLRSAKLREMEERRELVRGIAARAGQRAHPA